MYNAKINNIEHKVPDVTNLATNTILNAKINDVKYEIPSVTNLVSNVSLNAKINEVKSEIPSITNLVTTNTAFNAVENKIPNHSKYITTTEFNNLTAETFTARLKQANVTTKGDVANYVKKADFNVQLKDLNKKVTSNKSKHLLVENELKKLQDKNE